MTAFKKLTVPNPDDPGEVTLADGWKALEACGIGPEYRKDGIEALRDLQKPMHDALLRLQYMVRREQQLLAFVREQVDSPSISEGERKAFIQVLQKITGKPVGYGGSQQ